MPTTLLPVLAAVGTLLSALLFNYHGPTTDTSTCGLPDFPTGFVCNITDFQNWASEVTHRSLYTAWPENADQVLALANWAYQNNFKMRASGAMHGWAPFTVAADKKRTFFPGIFAALTSCLLRQCDPVPPTPKILLVKTFLMNSMNITSTSPQNASFWAQPGITMRSLFANLRKRSLGFLATPAPGDVTLGGVLAIGGHGTGFINHDEADEEHIGHTDGSMSNLILSVEAVVWDNDTKYILKNYTRSEYQMQGLLVHLGRTFITQVTMRAGILDNLTCTSYTNYTAEQLFANPDDPRTDPTKTIDHFLNETGRMETILFPFTGRPWLKVWKVSPQRPRGYSKVNTPFNYPFSDHIPKELSTLAGLLMQQANLVVALGPAQYQWTRHNLELHNSNLSRLWGPANTVLQYIKPTTLRVTANGYAILCERSNVQRVLHYTHKVYTDLLREYARKGLYPVNGPLEYRVTGVDNPADVGVNGARFSGLGANSPGLDSFTKNYNAVVWVDVLTYASTRGYATFMHQLERIFYDNIYPPYPDPDYDPPTIEGLMRVEWSKGWAYNVSQGTAWTDIPFLEYDIQPNFDIYDQSVFDIYKQTLDILNSLDPHRIFTCPLLEKLFYNDNLPQERTT